MPIEFILFGLMLAAIAVFHRHVLPIAAAVEDLEHREGLAAADVDVDDGAVERHVGRQLERRRHVGRRADDDAAHVGQHVLAGLGDDRRILDDEDAAALKDCRRAAGLWLFAVHASPNGCALGDGLAPSAARQQWSAIRSARPRHG